MSATIAIVGRPNVGKSTLFNRLIGRQHAIVDDQPGVTRDRREGDATLAGLRFRVIDTAGLEEASSGSLEDRMRRQTERAIALADVTMMVIDARAGVTPADKFFADQMRRTGAHVVLLANKCEGRAGAAGLAEAWELGLGEPVPISAAHGEGLVDLHDAIIAGAAAVGIDMLADPDDDDEDGFDDSDEPPLDEEGNPLEVWQDEQSTQPMRIAVVGRPNMGKSTLINRLLGEDRPGAAASLLMLLAEQEAAGDLLLLQQRHRRSSKWHGGQQQHRGARRRRRRPHHKFPRR